MANTLFCITSMSELLSDIVLSTSGAIIVTPRQDVYQHFSSCGKSVYLLEYRQNKSIEEVDKSFKELAMPGVFKDIKLGRSSLMAWQVLSLDRLKFWYSPHTDNYLDFIEELEWDKAYVSLDLGSVFPISVMRMAASYEFPVTAVKTEPIQTREVSDIAKHLTFDNYIVDSAADSGFLMDAGVRGKVEVIPTKVKKPQITFADKATLREGLRVADDITLVGMLFDKRDEWAARMYASRVDAHVLVYPVDDRSAELINSSFYPINNKITAIVNLQILGACEGVVTFRHDEGYPNIPDLKVLEYEQQSLPSLWG